MVRTRVGYCGGSTTSPTYHDLADHTEALQIDFDPDRISYPDLIERFWRAHDPTRRAWSRQYMAAVWCHDDTQRAAATELGERAAHEREAPLQTLIADAGPFHRAEDYHQKYRLRREVALVAELVDRYGSDRAMVDSTAAARINGYIGGHARRAAALEALPQLMLSADGERRLLARVNG